MKNVTQYLKFKIQNSKMLPNIRFTVFVIIGASYTLPTIGRTRWEDPIRFNTGKVENLRNM